MCYSQSLVLYVEHVHNSASILTESELLFLLDLYFLDPLPRNRVREFVYSSSIFVQEKCGKGRMGEGRGGKVFS